MSMLGTVKHVPKDIRYNFLNVSNGQKYVQLFG